MMKLRCLAEWLDRGIPWTSDRPGSFILMVDGYDCVFQLPPAAALSAHRAYGRPLLVSAEQGPGWPVPARLFPASPTPYRGPCAGVWIGTVDAARQMIAETEALTHEGLPPGHEQGLVQAYALAHRDSVAVDVNCLLAQTLALRDDNYLTRRGDLFVNTRTGSVPCVLHGAAGFDMTEIMETLGYDAGVPPPEGQKRLDGGNGNGTTPTSHFRVPQEL
jgi:hypothetical protein